MGEAQHILAGLQAEAIPGSTFRGRWRFIAAGIALAGVAAAITSNAWSDLFHLALNDEESSHVWLVPLIVVWLLLVRRHRLGRCGWSPSGLGALLVALGWASWTAGYRCQVQCLWHLGAVVMTLGAFLSAAGAGFVLQFLPVVAVLVFLVPVPATGRQMFAVPLQRLTAVLTQNAAEVLGVSTIRQGSVLTINGNDVAIAEACNGMRMVFSLFLACYVFAYANPLKNWVRVLTLVLSPVVAVAANVVRLVPTVWMFGHASHAAAEQFHDWAGWGMLIVAFAALTGIARVLNWAGLPVYAEDSRAGVAADCPAPFSAARASTVASVAMRSSYQGGIAV